MDIAVVGVGASVTLNEGRTHCIAARIGLAAVAPTPLYVREAGETLAGSPVDEASIAAAAEIARKSARPITDMRGTSDYRSHLCAVLTRRALEAAVERARERN